TRSKRDWSSDVCSSDLGKEEKARNQSQMQKICHECKSSLSCLLKSVSGQSARNTKRPSSYEIVYSALYLSKISLTLRNPKPCSSGSALVVGISPSCICTGLLGLMMDIESVSWLYRIWILTQRSASFKVWQASSALSIRLPSTTVTSTRGSRRAERSLTRKRRSMPSCRP